ncbi:MAG TPA: GspE/PulE family protein [Gemmatimonadales bacterium]|nr:GspE/PulE family protein [Gemmatimonadales bacterium]
MPFIDEWLVPTLSTLVPDDQIAKLRRDSDGASSVWESVVDRRMATNDQVLQALATRFRIPIADLTQIDHRITEAVPEQVARKFNIVPLRSTDSYLEIATANPFDIDAEKTLAFVTGREVRLQLGPPERIREKLEELYRPEDMVSKLVAGVTSEHMASALVEDQDQYTPSAEAASQRPIIKLVDTMIGDGITSRASDIHVEPAEGGLVVRYRIDGVLRQVMKMPRSAGLPLVSRIKIMSGMDIADRLRPQDGRCRVSMNGSPVDLRVSTLPASHGEKVVIRILNTKSTVLSLDALGLQEDDRAIMKKLLLHKEGIILVTGPTGSGKTTTLYASLRQVQSEGVNIVTVEDPVEYRLGANIVQVQTNEKAGLTFASALRSILRQDPDVVLIGEIRDKETAQIAVQASLTGHLVLSTLHTNDAPSAIARLLELGVAPYLLNATLNGVMAQRLVRTLCPHCKQTVELNRAEDQSAWDALVAPWKSKHPAKLYKPVGCLECRMTGFMGRVGIYETLMFSTQLKSMVSAGADLVALREQAFKEGMKPLRISGAMKVGAGLTTIDEVLKVAPPVRDSVR